MHAAHVFAPGWLQEKTAANYFRGRKIYKCKQISGIVPGLGRWQNLVYVFLGAGHFFSGRNNKHKQNPQKIPGQSRENILRHVCGSLDPFFMQQNEPFWPWNLHPREGNPLKHRMIFFAPKYFRHQEKGVLAKGVPEESIVTSKKPRNTQGDWTQQYIWHSEGYSQERRRSLQKPPSKNPLFLAPDYLCTIGPKIIKHTFIFFGN